MQSDVFNWSAALVLSLLIHGLLLSGSNIQLAGQSDTAFRPPLVARLNFDVHEQQKPPLVEPPRPLKQEQPEPVIKKVKKNRPKPVPSRPRKVEPVLPAEPRVPQQTAEPAMPAETPVVTGLPPAKASAADDGILRHKRQQYLQALLQHIESFKYYPRAARRRSLEGEVIISFILHNDGSYEALSVAGSHRILENAARESLASALPLPVPADDIQLNDKVEFVMLYSLHP